MSYTIFVFLDPPLVVDNNGLLHLGFQTKQFCTHLSPPHSKKRVIMHINLIPHNFLSLNDKETHTSISIILSNASYTFKSDRRITIIILCWQVFKFF